MKKVCKRIHVEVRRYIAILLVLTMIPIPSFPVKAVEVEEIPMENKVQQAETISEDTMQYEIVTEQSLATQTDTVQSTVTQSVDTDCANAYLDPAIREKSIGDVKISENWVLEEDAVVDELVMVGESIDLNGYTLTVCEDLIFEKGELITSGGELIVWGDLRMQSRIWDEEQGIYSYGSSTAKFRTYYISEETVYILVAGDMYVDSENADYGIGGTLELKGNLYQRENGEEEEPNKNHINFMYNHNLILSGEKQQVIQWDSAHTFNQMGNLYIENYSAEGIVFDGVPFIYAGISMKREQKVSGRIRVGYSTKFYEPYYGGDIEANKSGSSCINGDVEIDGNIFVNSSMSIDGNVTVNKDIIVEDTTDIDYSSYLRINSEGTLKVLGDINAAKTTREWGMSVTASSENTGLYVKGNAILNNVYMDLGGKARFELEGNLELRNATPSTGIWGYATLVFCGNKKQELLIGEPKQRLYFSNLEICNSSEEGVHLDLDEVWIANLKLNGNALFLDGKRVREPFQLTEDTILEDDYYFVGGILDLNGYKLTCHGDVSLRNCMIDVNEGVLEAYGNLNFKYWSGLCMDCEKDRAYIYSDFKSVDASQKLTAGELTLYSDVEIDNYFYTEDTHITRILRKNYTDESNQTIKIVDEETGTEVAPIRKPFANLYISRKPEKYYTSAHAFEDLAENLYYYGYPEESPTQVTGLTVSDAGYFGLNLKYDASTDDEKVIGYEIYRDGSLIGTTEETNYKDSGLDYHTEYTYQVYAYDEVGNKSPASEPLYAVTKADTIPPEKVEGLTVTRQTTTGISMKWESAKDDLEVIGYHIYRNGELLKEVQTGTSYTDTSADAEQDYEYEITAVDRGGNESEKSNAVQARIELPQIISVYPEEQTDIGGRNTKMYIYLKVCPLGSKQYLTADYFDNNTKEWINILSDQSVDTGIGDEMTCMDVVWDHASVTRDQNIKVRYRVRDSEYNQDEKIVTYHLDRTGPTLPEWMTLSENNTDVIINWSASTSDDIKTYQLYGRKQGDDYSLLTEKTAEDSRTYSYIHKNLEQEVFYEYCIVCMDGFENRTTSGKQSIFVGRDSIPPTPPNDVSMRKRSGSAITLTWNGATDNVAVTAYNLYRDGELIAEGIKGHTYKDSGLKENTLYTYQLTALDEAGNESEKSKEVDGAVSMPEILEISPKDYAILGGESTNIEVRYKDCGNSTGNTVQLFWYDHEAKNWNTITPQPLMQEYYQYGILRSKTTWIFPETATGEDVDIDVKVVVTDVDGNTDEQIVTYTIDQTAPTPPAELEVAENNGIVVLTFSPSSSVDAAGYILYRKAEQEDTYREIARIEGRTSGWHQDKMVETNGNYIYRLTAYDIYGREGNYIQSDVISISADKSRPSIKSMTPQAGDVNKKVSICVEGKDNRAVAKAYFYIRTDEETDWTFLGEKAAENNTAIYEWDTTALSDGIYYIKAVVADEAGNENENLYQRCYKVDNTGISKIKFSECTAGSTMVQLTWEDVTEEDFSYFHVEQKGDDAWISRAEISDQLGYVVNGLTPEESYTFRVTGYDRLGNKGEPSDEITLTTHADTIAPSIVKIDPVTSYYGNTIRLSMHVKDNASLAKGVFSYSTDEESFTVIKELPARNGVKEDSLSYNWNTAELPEGNIFVRFEVYDAVGLHDQFVNTYIIDHTAPKQVQNLVASSTEGYVGLTWEASAEKDLRAYRIYRSTSSDKGYVLVREQSRMNYYDTNVVQGQTYYYKVSAVDMAGNESEWSDYAFGSSLPDTVAPVITGISPKDGEKLGSEATFSVLATDNSQLHSVRMEYRKKDSTDIWQEISTAEVGGREKYVRISFDATNLSEEEAYDFRAVAYDRAGNASEYVSAAYTFDLTPPQTPEISTSSMSYRIGVSISGDTDPDFDRYEIYRKALDETEYKCIQSTKESSYEDTTTDVNTIYYYKVRAYDIYGNYSESDVSYNYANDVDTIAPVAVLAETYMSVTGLSMRFDGTTSSDNVRIVSYEWDFGDGTKKTGAKPVHTYEKADTYTISLTVTDGAGNQNMAVSTICVFDGENYGQTRLKVIDEKGAPLAGAHVYIKTGNNDTDVIRTRADANGDVSVVTKAGVYEFAAYAEGYLPKEDTIRVSNYEKLSQEILLQKGEIVTGEMTAKRMTLDELVEYGVDLSDPENYNTFKFKVELTFEETPIPVTHEFVGVPTQVEANSNYYICQDKNTGDDYKIQAICQETEDGEMEVKSVIYLSTTQSVSWLKDMYDVQLTVMNHADSNFPIEQASATLSLPDGLSLAQTKSGQTLTTHLGTIAGQTSATAHWVVRGDKSGTYSIDASFHGILMPFEVPVSNLFTTDQEFEVNTGEGLEIIVSPEDAMYLDSRYYIQFKIRNNSERDFYNLTTSLGEYIEPAKTVQYITKDAATGALLSVESRTQGQTYHSSSAAKCKTIPVLYEGDTVKIGVFSPGEEILCTYATEIKGDITAEHYYTLVDSLVKTLEGANLGVKVSVQSIPSHLSRYICYEAGSIVGAEAPEKEKETYGDPVDVASGAFTQQINSLAVTGASTLELSLAYNSLLTEYEGQGGYGWSHSYEQSLKDIGGVIELRSTPYSVASFVSDELNKDTMYGYKSGSDIVLDDEAEYPGSYSATGSAMKGAVIEKKKENGKYRYVLTDLSGTTSTFDQDGKLIACEDKNGKSVTLTHKEDKL
ncbi:MAG: PKD domain-containing protein, partial [Lachnospiraceae bacterium]|nr:PKD domain-containing protein [Lachnospiraceae bacterium]